MKYSITSIFIFFTFFQFGISNAQETLDTLYGDNEAIGKYIEINGAKIYYEEYGKGEPLLLIHGNGASIKSMENQIENFKSKYRVIIADNRGHGKSELKTDSLTYNQITSDWDGLVNHLKLDSVNILGWSDGGIIGLLMGISKQSNIRKIVAMAPNLRPDTTAVHPWAPAGVRKSEMRAKEMIAKGDTSTDWQLKLQHYDLLLNQPNISHAQLKSINVPVLVMVGDRDIIKNIHAVEMFDNLTKGQLSIMPGNNHGAPRNTPVTFNEIATRFLSEPFDYTPGN